jgi:hypothetical protein
MGESREVSSTESYITDDETSVEFSVDVTLVFYKMHHFSPIFHLAFGFLVIQPSVHFSISFFVLLARALKFGHCIGTSFREHMLMR